MKKSIEEGAGQVYSVPSAPGMMLFPNSAPDSFTPKNWNFVRVPEQMEELEVGAVAVDVALLGWHCVAYNVNMSSNTACTRDTTRTHHY